MSRIAVALATCNGRAHLEVQLRSLTAQSRRPDEIVLRDDRSEDGTLELARRILDGTGIRLDIATNPERLGSSGNFEAAVRACTADIVFLCDQDDHWDADKIETMAARLDTEPGIGWIFCDARIGDAELRDTGEGFWHREGFRSRRKRLFLSGDQIGPLLSRSVVMGCAMAFRRDLGSAILPIGEGWVHDEWIALGMAARGIPGGLVDRPLQTYRTHPAQQIGPSVRANAPRGVRARLEIIEAEIRKLGILQSSLPAQGHPEVALKIAHMRARAGILRAFPTARPLLAVREALTGRYARYSRSILGVVRDVSGI